MSDVFDLVGRKVAVAVVDTALAIERFDEPFRSGGITALEELWFRLTGKHLDWEVVKAQLEVGRETELKGRLMATQPLVCADCAATQTNWYDACPHAKHVWQQGYDARKDDEARERAQLSPSDLRSGQTAVTRSAKEAGIGSTEPASSMWPASVPPGESPNYPPPTIEDDVLTYAGFRWQRLPVPTVEPASSTEPPADLREQLFNVLVENTLHQPRQAIVDVLMPLINAAIARAAKPNQRLHDLVRHQRMELHAEELITDEEYAALAEDHAAVKRLEDYDEAIARAKADAVRPYERLIAIIRTSHDLGIYHEKDGRCEVCEILGVPRKLLEGR